jgi:alkanesulfonate monooxygenase SsuD/methylene tetrahydromethanopterin reductase-like flavin-dependent oxidoreductase (luciferase family)
MGFAFAHHFASYDAVEALTHYRKRFTPSPSRSTPWSILAVAVVCGATDDEAEYLAQSMDLNRLRRDRCKIVVLRRPVAGIAQRIDVLRQVDRIPQRLRWRRAGGDEGQVEDGEFGHGEKLTACRPATRRGPALQGHGSVARLWEAALLTLLLIIICPSSHRACSSYIY